MAENTSLNKLRVKRKELSDRAKELSDLIVNKALNDEDASNEQKEADDVEKRAKDCDEAIKRVESKLQKDAEEAEDKDEDETETKTSKSFGIVKTTGSGLNPAYTLGYKLSAKAILSREGMYDGAKKIKDQFGKNAEYILKDLTTTSTPVVAQDYNTDAFVELRRARSPFRQYANIISMSEGNTTIPRQYEGAMCNWAGEAQAAVPSQLNVDNVNLIWKKLFGFTYTTKELLMYSALNMGEKIVNDLIKQMDVYEGLAYANNSSISQVQPLGLPGMVTSDNVVKSTGTDFASVWATLNTALARIRGNNIFGPLVWAMSVEGEFFLRSLLNSFGVPVFANMMDEGNILGIPFYSTALFASNLPNDAETPTNTVAPIYLYAPENFVIADAGSFAVEQTNQGSFITGSGTQINTFGQDLIAWKSTTRLDTALTLDNALVQVRGDGWSFSNLSSAVANIQTRSTSKSSASAIGN